MITAPYMGLAVWNSVTDTWNHEQLADNFRKIDEHNHASGRGRQIPTGGIEDGAVTRAKLAPETLTIEDGSIDTRHLRELAVHTSKINFGAVIEDRIRDGAITSSKVRDGNISARHLLQSTRNALGIHSSLGRGYRRFTPHGRTAVGAKASAPRSGQSGTLKVALPNSPGGSLLHIYAEGTFTIYPAGPKGKKDDFINVIAYAQITYGNNSIRMPLFIGRRSSLTGVRANGASVFANWASHPGISAYSSRTEGFPSVPPVPILRNKFRTVAGGPITKYIPANNSVALVELQLFVGNRWTKGKKGTRPVEAKPYVQFHTQTLSVWTHGVSGDNL